MPVKHFPRKGDKVNDKRRIPNANGFVQRVIYDDGPDQVVVKFDDDIVFYDFDEFRYTWRSYLGGVYELHQTGDHA